MKLSTQQLEQFESLLKSQGYKRDYGYKGEFIYWKTILQQEDLKVCVELTFYDFSKYDQYIPKEFPISFEPKIIVIQNALSTELHIPFIYDKQPLFTKYDNEKKCFVEKELSNREIENYLRDLWYTSLAFNEFYKDYLQKYIIN